MSNAWWITLDSFMILIFIPGGFFMFRAFLRKMKPDDSSENQKSK